MITAMSNGTPADLAPLVPHFRFARQRGTEADPSRSTQALSVV